MDLFDIIIGLIILYSLFGGLFKKKQPQKQSGKDHQQPRPEPQKVEKTSYTEMEDFDILKEVEALFGKVEPQKPTEVKYKPKPVVIQKKDESEYLPSYSEHTASDSFSIKKQDKIRKLASTPTKYKSLNQKLKELEVQFAGEVKIVRSEHPLLKKFRDPKLMKDFILVAEVLGKPKAFRRRNV